MKARPDFRWLLLLASLVLTGFLWPFQFPSPAADKAIVNEHLVASTRGWDYTILRVDGRPLVREPVPFGVDMWPGAEMDPGVHQFRVSRHPHGRRPGDVPSVIEFSARVRGGQRYVLGTGADHQPALFPWATTGSHLTVEDAEGPQLHFPAPNYAGVQDQFPHLTKTWIYTIVAVDGHAFARESEPWLAGVPPGIQLPAGVHRFQVSRIPGQRPPGSVPEAVAFEATLEAGRTYFIGTVNSQPRLLHLDGPWSELVETLMGKPLAKR